MMVSMSASDTTAAIYGSVAFALAKELLFI